MQREITVQLHQWLHNIFEAGWQSVEDILVPKEPHLAFRYSSSRAGQDNPSESIYLGKASATLDSVQEKPNFWRGVRESPSGSFAGGNRTNNRD